MHLCDLTYAYNEYSGGIRTYIEAKRAYVREQTDWKHLLIIPGAEDSVETDGRLTVCRIKSPVIPGSAPYRMVLRLGKVTSLLRQFRPDAIELGSLYTLPWAAFSYRRRHPVALHCFYHTDLPSVYVEPAVRKLLGRRAGRVAFGMASAYMRALLRRYDATVTASPAVRDKLIEAGFENTHFVPLGVNLDTFNPVHRDESFRASLGATENDIVMIYAGRFDSEKRVLVMVEAMKNLNENNSVTLVLVGQGPLENELRETAARSARLKLIPYQQEKASLARMYASADVYLAGNPHETFGLSVVEAQASGLPVVGVRSGALVERVSPENGVLVEPDSARAMADGVRTLLNAEVRREKSRAARRHVEEHFSWSATFRKLFPLYEQSVRGVVGSNGHAAVQGQD
ncbi:MAG: glycosyltransferase [Rhodothermales bacterium]|nr:glycosyltransferase [Rhodothermales bacterium]